MTYFTSDQHFGHFNIIRLSRRPFKTVEEMDETMVKRWNAKVRDDDTVYVLGDLFFRAATVEPILKRLKGHKHLMLGNHDPSWTDRVDLADYFESVQTLKEVRIDGRLDYCGEDLPTFDEEVRITYVHEFGHCLGLSESEQKS